MRSLSNKAIDQELQIMVWICASPCCTPMHAIPLDLLLYVDNAQLLPARYFGIDLLFGFKFPGHTGCIHCQHPILLCLDMEPGQFCEVDFEEETAFYGHFFGSKVGLCLYFLHDLCGIHSMEIPMSSVVERNVSVNTLGVCDLLQFQNELLSPVLLVEIAT